MHVAIYRIQILSIWVLCQISVLGKIFPICVMPILFLSDVIYTTPENFFMPLLCQFSFHSAHLQSWPLSDFFLSFYLTFIFGLGIHMKVCYVGKHISQGLVVHIISSTRYQGQYLIVIFPGPLYLPTLPVQVHTSVCCFLLYVHKFLPFSSHL